MATTSVSVCFVIFAVFISASSSSPTMDAHQLELKQHYDHISYIAGFPCHEPQARVFRVGKIFSKEQSYGKAYFPDVTVLHRCDECVGSCTSGMECVAKHIDRVLLPFKATFLETMGHDEKGSWKMEYHELLNHTECHCSKIPPKEVCQHDYKLTENSHNSIQSSSGSPTLQEGYAGVSQSSRPSGDGFLGSSSRPSGDNYLGSSTVYPNIPVEETVDVRSSTSEATGREIDDIYSSLIN